MSRTKNIAIVEYLGNYPLNVMSHGIAERLLVSICVLPTPWKESWLIWLRKNPGDIDENMVLDGWNDVPRDLKHV